MLIVTPISIPVRFEGVTYKKGETFEMAEKHVSHKHLRVLERKEEPKEAPKAEKGNKKAKASSKEA